ncbi:MAG: M48 family metalloprotease [Planctomycetes bacterium]|nr:M48 family metalloprotease [Planctomycetota bacterium]
MGSLGHAVLALSVLAAAEAGFEHELAPPWSLVLLVPLAHALARLAEHAYVRGRFRAGDWLHRSLVVSPVALHAVAVLGCGWRTSVSRWTGADVSLLAWPDLGVLLLLAPWLLFELAALHARSRTFVARPQRDAWLGFQVRMLVAGLVPIVLYVLAAAIVGTSEDARVAVEEIGVFHAIFAGGLVLALALGLPYLLEHVWETAPMPDGSQRAAVMALARESGFGAPRLRVWRTGNQVANAAIVGLTKNSRTVLFSDQLLAQLPPRELAAVFAHEMGHAVRSHVPLFIAWVLAAFLLGDLAARTLFEDDPVLAGLVLLAFLGAWFAGFSWLSRRCELQADLHALDLLGETHTLIGALERVGGRLRDVAGWRHFSVSDRVRFLEHAQADPEVARRLHRTIRGASLLGSLLLLAALGLHAARLARDLPTDRVRADLRLGDYQSAALRAERIDGLDPELAAAVRLAGTLGSDGVEKERVEREARAARARGDDAAAEVWEALAGLRR